MNELLDYFQSILSYAETNAQNLNQESQLALAEFIQQLAQFIEEQSRVTEGEEEGPIHPPGGGPGPNNIQEAMPSSNVEGFAYDDKNNRLLVRFLGQHPNRNGPIYSYEGVPRNIFDLFRTGSIPARTNGQNKWGRWFQGKVPSIGASLFTLIKNQGYQYQRVA